MKRIYSFLVSITFSLCLSAQMVAPDWTLTDCASDNYNLYSILDSQEVVVMEFSHGCASCTNAASYLMNIKAQYDVSHPGKVNWFFMDYNGNDCPTVNGMIAPYDFDAAFINCVAQKNDYYPSIFPMPAIVIAAGNYHTVIFQHQTWVNSDTTAIKNAIDQFFATVGVEPANEQKPHLMYPIPVTTYPMHITLKKGQIKGTESIKVYNAQGGEIKTFEYDIQDGMLIIDFYELQWGNYILEVLFDGKPAIYQSFIKS